MEELSNLISNIARFLAFGIGGVSVIVFLYAGFLFMTAAGDPQNTAKARMAIFGAFIGLVVAGAAFVIPRIVSQAIIEPAGGVSIVTDGQISCDRVLEEQLVNQRGANNAQRMNEVIRLIQQRQECSSEIWNPLIRGDFRAANFQVTGSDINPCWGTWGNQSAWAIGNQVLPQGLRDPNSNPVGKALKPSYRDPSNNILIYFDGGRRPGDDSVCWLYTSRIRSWSRGY